MGSTGTNTASEHHNNSCKTTQEITKNQQILVICEMTDKTRGMVGIAGRSLRGHRGPKRIKRLRNFILGGGEFILILDFDFSIIKTKISSSDPKQSR